jgi:hypothetical protein
MLNKNLQIKYLKGSNTLLDLFNITNTTDFYNIITNQVISNLSNNILYDISIDDSFTFNNQNISQSLESYTFNIQNNVSTPSSITNLVFDKNFITGFNVILKVNVLTSSHTNDIYSLFTFQGLYNSKLTTWNLSSTYVGDSNSISFSIDSSGQIYYTIPNITGFISGNFIFKSNCIYL